MGKASRALRADGEATYNRILEAAGTLIAAAGFAHTTSKAIAAEAGVDLASINYHFKSRSGLYEAVLAEAHRRVISIDELQRIEAEGGPPRDRLKTLIDGLVDRVAGQHGWHSAVLGRELLSPSPHLRVMEQMEIRPKLRIVLGILSEITGIPANDPALVRCLVSIAAPCAIMLVAGRSLSIIEEQMLHAPRAELADHLYRFALGGLEAIGKARASG